jgi:hypothetical protein
MVLFRAMGKASFAHSRTAPAACGSTSKDEVGDEAYQMLQVSIWVTSRGNRRDVSHKTG